MERYINKDNVNDITYMSELTRHRTLAGSIRPNNLRTLRFVSCGLI